MNTKKSGLADSPFFRPPPIPAPPPQIDSQTFPVQETPASVPLFLNRPHERTPEQPHEGTTAQLHNRADAHLNERTNEQLPKRSTAQLHERTPEQQQRPKSRESYDVFVDQAQAIEELALKWKKERGKHITIGQVMRELLDEILPKKR